MDAEKNPFSPGAGSRPSEIVGRDKVLEEAKILLGRILNKRSEKSMLLTGLRGVGKTVLLNEVERMATQKGYRTIFIEAHEDKRLGHLIVPYLRSILLELDVVKNINNKAKRAWCVLRNFANAFKVTFNDVTYGLNFDSEKGVADSQDIEIDLPNLFVAVAEAAEEKGCAIAIVIDEIQYFTQKELGAVIMAMHKVQQKNLPLLLLGAGLPVLPGLAGNAKSYAERLFSFPDIGPLSEQDAFKALQEPVHEFGVSFEEEALEEIFRLTKGYPYFIQEWGSLSWNLSPSKIICLSTVRSATDLVVARLDSSFFRVRYDRLTSSERRFLRGMAELGSDTHKMADVADVLEVKTSSISPRRAQLIQKGMIYSPAYGDVAFTVPLFDEFMKRALPEFSRLRAHN